MAVITSMTRPSTVTSCIGAVEYAEIFEIAFNKFSLNKEECFYVGNDLHDDVLGASGVGVKTVYIETEQSGKYPNLNIKPDYVVNTHYEMKELLYSLVENKND